MTTEEKLASIPRCAGVEAPVDGYVPPRAVVTRGPDNDNDPAWRSLLEQVGMSLDPHGRYHVSPPEPGLEHWLEQLRALDTAPTYVNGVPVRRQACTPMRFEVACYELSANVGLGSGARERITKVMTLWEAAAFVRAGRCPHYKYSATADRWSGDSVMSWDHIEMVRVRVEFVALGGGELWDTIEQAAWQWRQLYLAQQREEQRERYRWKRATPSGRAQHNAAKAAGYHARKACTIAVRGCAECGVPFAINKVARARGSDRHCSLSCAAKARVRKNGGRFGNSVGKPVVIDGVARTRREWAEHFGISLVAVHYRMTVRGMSEVEALTTPKSPGRRKVAA
jgi:hypothetical protein